MLADCSSLSNSQYFILLLLLIVQVSFYRRHVYFQYGVIATLLLLVIYPILLDPLPREGFAVFFTVILVLYSIQLIYLSFYVSSVIPSAVITVVYAILFFIVSTFLNTTLFFTKPVDMALGLWDKAEDLQKTAKKVVEYGVAH